jgi:hypothetical protein
MNEFNDTVGQIAGKVWAVVRRAVFAEAARDEHLGVAVREREFDVGVGFVVAQKDVEAWLSLLDEVVFERQCFMLVSYEDVVDIDSFAHEGAGFGVGLGGFQQIRTDPGTKVICLADIDDFSLGVFVEVDTRFSREEPNFLEEIHKGEGNELPASRIAAGMGGSREAGGWE